jgi:hypothetical protein
MNRNLAFVGLSLLLACLPARPASACQYNVRDIGFIDLGVEPYRLYVYINADTSEHIITTIRQVATAALLDSNVVPELVNLSQPARHPAARYVDLWQIKSFPAAVLVSPDDQSLPVALPAPEPAFKQTLWAAMEKIVSSEKREQIVHQTSSAFGAVLLIQTANASDNEKAHQAASRAIETIGSQMKMMPKPIEHPPVLIALGPDSYAAESILLWSIGLEPDKINEPCVIVLYGRARRIGPVLKAEQITELRLTNILSVIGADCECGLDRRWMLGTELPVRWDQNTRTQVAKALGFDPESPLVKAEVRQILGRGPFMAGTLDELDSSAPVSFGYREFVVEFNPSAEASPAEPKPLETIEPPLPEAPQPLQQPLPVAQSYPGLRYQVFVLAGLGAAVLFAGVAIILVRVKRK